VRCYTRLAFPGFDSRYSIPAQCALQQGHEGAHRQHLSCPELDFVTSQPCVRNAGHEPFHQLEDGTAFPIGYDPSNPD
jgi:hypothetical protein